MNKLIPDNPLIKLFRSELLSMSAYKVADAKNMIKLDAMENPYSWPETIQQQWLETLKTCAINRYPDPEAKTLCEVLCSSNGLPENASLLLGNGSDEIIQILLMALAPGAYIIAPEPSFVMYRQIAQSLGLNYRGVPLLAESFDLDLSTMLSTVNELKPALIFLAYPNNPTGNLFDAAAIKSIIASSPGLVVIDEAYAPFADASFIEHLANFNNVLVMRTVSKLGLAGLRLGFLIGAPALLEQLHKLRLPYNINCLTQATATFALNNADFLKRQTQSIRQERHLVFTALQAMDKIKPYPSSANFILFKTLGVKADHVFNALKQQGVLIKNMSQQGGILENCLRVTIGKPLENQAFLTALQAALMMDEH